MIRLLDISTCCPSMAAEEEVIIIIMLVLGFYDFTILHMI